MFKKLICKLFGHKRGKRKGMYEGRVEIACPRCTSTWTRKVKK